MNFLDFFCSKYHEERGKVGWPAGVASWGGQLEWPAGVASLGWLQPSFFIVCLNQGHFFPKFFSSISMIKKKIS
jgi:hypothetical protein